MYKKPIGEFTPQKRIVILLSSGLLPSALDLPQFMFRQSGTRGLYHRLRITLYPEGFAETLYTKKRVLTRKKIKDH